MTNLESLLKLSLQNGASDLHLSAGICPMMRVDGDICTIDLPELSAERMQELAYSAMNEEQILRFEEYWELDFSLEIENLSRFRVNIFKQARGLAAVFRVIPENVPSLEELNCPKHFKEIIDMPHGLILVTGPTGSGKSTTLAAMVDYFNKTRRDHIVTIEDPIEFIHQPNRCLINQREVHRDTQSFSNALRASLREDPDIILVGEMRDIETIRLALTAAETGHLVIATLHTASATKTIDRIIDAFPAGEKQLIRSMLSESLRAIISQKLLKKIEGGRTAAWEIIVATAAIKNLIREDKIAQMYSMIQTGRSHGMWTLDQHLKELIQAGTIDKELAKTLANDQRGL